MVLEAVRGFENPEVKDVLHALKSGKNVLLHGPAGTGKSYLIKNLLVKLREKKLSAELLAPTGVAAYNITDPTRKIFARTIHSFFGIGPNNLSKEMLFIKLDNNYNIKEKIKHIDIIIIDEISMVGKHFFEKLDYAVKIIRSSDELFGGIRIVASGDFLQLPPVKDEFIFFSSVWIENEKNFEFLSFNEHKRFEDEKFFDILLAIREGKVNKKIFKMLEECNEKYENWIESEHDLLEVKPTMVFSKKVNVEYYNKKELDKIDNKKHIFRAEDKFVSKDPYREVNPDIYKIMLSEMLPDRVEIKVGAQVMLKCNIDIEIGLVNGTRGVITEIRNTYVVVKTFAGEIRKIKKHIMTFEDDYAIVHRQQLPFILSFATTIHKTQGLTLDTIIIDLGPSVFCPGQAFVAMSRVKTIKGLYISQLRKSSIFCEENAKKYTVKILDIEEKKYDEESSE